MEQLIKEYEEQSKFSNRKVRDTKELQGVLVDRIKEYEEKSQRLAEAYSNMSKMILQVFPNNLHY